MDPNMTISINRCESKRGGGGGGGGVLQKHDPFLSSNITILCYKVSFQLSANHFLFPPYNPIKIAFMRCKSDDIPGAIQFSPSLN